VARLQGRDQGSGFCADRGLIVEDCFGNGIDLDLDLDFATIDFDLDFATIDFNLDAIDLPDLIED